MHNRGVASPLLLYSSVFFFIAFGDAIMSYVSPIYIESFIQNTFFMGLIISTSSIVGFCCDFILAKLFPDRHYIFFFWFALLAAVLFPATFLVLDPALLVFIFGMVTWGIYYELFQFSHFNFISEFILRQNYQNAWATISTFKSIAYIVGPVVAAFLIQDGIRNAFVLPLFLYSLAFVGFIFLIFFLKPVSKNLISENKISVASQTRIWLILFRRIWPVYIFLLLISIIDSAFWTVGILISQNIRQISPLGNLLLPAYGLPGLFTLFILSRFPPTGKKRVALFSGVFAGLLLAFVGFTQNPVFIILFVFLSSCFLSVSFPEIQAVFEDYVNRLKDFGSNMIGLEGSAVSVSYIIGPIIAGALAQIIGNRQLFTVLGLILSAFSLITFFVIPKKIRLPEREIANI